MGSPFLRMIYNAYNERSTNQRSNQMAEYDEMVVRVEDLQIHDYIELAGGARFEVLENFEKDDKQIELELFLVGYEGRGPKTYIANLTIGQGTQMKAWRHKR